MARSDTGPISTKPVVPSDLPLRLIRLKEVKQRTGMSTSTIYRWMQAGKFPRSYPLGDTIVVWSEAAIDDWVRRVLANDLSP